MNIIIVLGVSLAILAVVPPSPKAQEVPPDCVASFKVKPEKLSVDISWALATGKSAALSCGAAEALRERFFVEGDKVLKESELTGAPAAAQQRAVTALNDLKDRVQKLPGNDVPGTIFSAGGYLVSKYMLVSCLLTAEAAGGTCWGVAAGYIGSSAKFFQKIYTNEKNTIAKQDLLSEINKIEPALTSLKPGQPDQAGARTRWIQTQTNLCRAVQRDCL